jgi:hypothetical protein
MDVRTRYTETLAFAAATIGGTGRLAEFLDVPRSALLRWLAGEEVPPVEIFLSAFDLIADEPFAAPEQRLPRALP